MSKKKPRYNREEVTELLFLSHKIKEKYKKEGVIKTLEIIIYISDNFNDLQKNECSKSTIKRILDFENLPVNLTEVSISHLVKSIWGKSLGGFINGVYLDLEEFKKSEKYDRFFLKWDNTKYHIKENEYNFPVAEMESSQNNQSTLNSGETQLSNSNILFLERLKFKIEKEKIEKILDKEYYYEIKEYINLFRDKRLKPILRNIILDKVEELKIALQKHEESNSFLDKLNKPFRKSQTERTIMKSIQKEFKVKLQKLYKEEYK
ncbi:hypothetical protein IMCC3317_17720 [Kordia antarctica]|uniref:Uncharacterized protein n=1 Tax=Kordia antarctica TaxID=1218801 RepID=A0A7L4ZJ07_9FLAO|nr:hypothetical protein [Kordia antarctica]QHI36409.1 hypothetical protein IMCC3317_17720 [Kordia antarctica]